MAQRNFPDWLTAYCDYASFTEAPRRMHFWCGVSAIAGALRRRVWIDMQYFVWTPCFYIILVAPPGIVSKTTTADVAMRLLRTIPGIKFGPQAVTWPALVLAFQEATEQFEYGDMWYTQSAMTLESGEFGNLVNPEDREMIDLLVTLWDSKQGYFSKATKGCGKEQIENAWINMLACTTPAWIAGNFPDYMIGGGFTSRCIFIYADKKERIIAYPHRKVPPNIEQVKMALAQDLERISMQAGPYVMTDEALDWGENWYKQHYASIPKHLDDDRFAGYRARKQTHLHKLALIISAAQRDDQIITATDLILALKMLNDIEEDMPKVFDKIGRTEVSVNAERFINFVKVNSPITYTMAYKALYTQFPQFKDIEQILQGAVKSGQIKAEIMTTGDYMLTYIGK